MLIDKGIKKIKHFIVLSQISFSIHLNSFKFWICKVEKAVNQKRQPFKMKKILRRLQVQYNIYEEIKIHNSLYVKKQYKGCKSYNTTRLGFYTLPNSEWIMHIKPLYKHVFI